MATLAFIAFLNPQPSHAIFRKCLLILEGWSNRLTSLPDYEFDKGEAYNIVVDDKVMRAKFLGTDYNTHDKEGLDYLTFQDTKTKEIHRIPRLMINGVVEDNYNPSPHYTLNAPYKIHTTDGRVLNGIFVGEKVTKGDISPSKIAILNLETGKVETYFSWEIFHVKRNNDLAENIRSEEAPKDLPTEFNFDKSTPVTAIPHSHHGNIRIEVDSKMLAAMTPGQKRAFNAFVDVSLEKMARFDANMRRAFPMQRIDNEVTIRFLTPEYGAYTHASKLEIGGRDAFFIRMPLDLSRSDLGLDVSTILHERGHHYGHNANISSGSNISLLDDLGYIEGLADYFMAHELRDPAMARGIPEGGLWYRHLERREELVNGKIRVIRSPLDAERFGRLEGHALSTFYSYPMWRAFVASQQNSGNRKITPPDLWKDFHKDMEKNYEIYQEYRKGSFVGEIPHQSEESEMLQNIDFFYSYFYKEAYLNPKTPAEKRHYLQAAYNDAKKNFTLPWSSIEVTAGKMQSLTDNPNP